MMKRNLLTSMCVLACASMQIVHAQQISVAGKVTNDNGTPIQGVTIIIKGTKQGTSTNANGLFSINADQNATLLLSAVGYTAQEVKLNGRKTISVTLKEAGESLDEVMVVAYGTAKKSTFTGSASTVSNKNIKDVPTTSFENALNGRVAGLQVTSSSGQAGSASNIRIRGIGSINASNEPLYVIDGVPVVSGSAGQMEDYLRTTNNVMSSLNPNDIESITVLKDAAASSLYGSRAANGVILITTKKGKSGKPTIDFRSSIGFTPSWATKNYETASVQDQVNMLYQVFYDYNTSAKKDEATANADALRRLNAKFNMHGYRFETSGIDRYANVNILGMTDGVENREGKYYNWQDDLFRTAIFQNNDVSLSGGNDNTKYFSSLGYTSDKGRVIENKYKRISGRLNFSQKITDNLEFGTNINISNNNKSGFNDTRSTGSNYFFQTQNLLWPLYWPTDYKTGQPYTARYGSLAYNANFYNTQWDNNSKTDKVSAITNLTWNILPNLTAKTVFSYDNTEIKEYLYYSPQHYNGLTDNGFAQQISTAINKLVSSNTLNYATSIGLHQVNILAGFEAEKNKTDFIRATGRGIGSTELPYVSSAGKFDANAYSWGYNMLSVLSRAEYNYDETYYASASYRKDGASKLGPNTRWGDFWSIAGALNLKKLALQDYSSVNSLRLKASYGVNGTLPTSDFGWRRLINYTYNYKGQPGGFIVSNPDSDIRWETSYTSNIGIEFGLFGNRLTGSVEYFNRTSKDLLQDVPTSQTTGFSSVLRNVGQINNKGLEIELGGDILRKEDFRWSANINAAFIKSTVQKLNDGKDIIWTDPTGGDARSQFIYQEGQSTLAFYGYEWAGVDPTNGKNVYYTNNNINDFTYNGRNASYSYQKANYVIIGNGIPKVSGGINTDIEYQNFALGFNFIYKLGGKIYDGANKDVADDGYYWERIRSQAFYENMWTEYHKDATYPKLDGNDLTDAQQYSSRQLYDASFIRLKNINLSYRLPQSTLSKIGIRSTRLYFNGTNLLTASKYKNADPEVGQYATKGWEIPFGKTYTFGIEIGF